MKNKLLPLIIGFFLRSAKWIFPIKDNIWVFGAQGGDAFVDNSKYLFCYVHENCKDINPIWICKSNKLVLELRKSGYKAYNNFSLIGIWHCLRSGKAFFSTSRGDILFNYRRKNREIINLWHGMPMKKIVYDYLPHQPSNRNFRSKIWDFFVVGYNHKDVAFIASTSDFFSGILKSCFKNDNVFVTGQPRTDSFKQMDSSQIRKELGLDDNDYVVTYMPTHRNYGEGVLNPRIFIDYSDAIDFFKSQGIKIIWKFHKNMLSKIHSDVNYDDSVFIDICNMNCDPQEILYISDALITDYSSCYIDFLLLKRPIAFYIYDNYEVEDNELYFSPEDHEIGEICRREEGLLKWIEQNYEKSDGKIVNDFDLYHKYADYNSCERIVSNLIAK